jgi:Tfp pilus assembly protein PilF
MTERVRIGLLLGIALLVYANGLVNGFTYDDEGYILRSHAVQSGSLGEMFQPTKGNNIFRPLTFATFALNWAVGGAQPFGYHLVNLLLHAAVTLLLYLVLRVLLVQLKNGELVAFAAAVLFAVHPIHTEAVTSIVGRSELLAAGFLFAGWLLHLQDRTIAALLCFAMALLSKESAVVFLPLVLAGDYALGKFKSPVRYGAMGALTAAYIGLLWKVQGGHFAKATYTLVDNPLASLPPLWRVLNALRIAWKYVGLQIYPGTLSYDYSYNAVHMSTDCLHTLPAVLLALAVLVLWAWTVWTKRAPWVLAGAIYLGGFAVTANLLVLTGTVMGERLAYLPSAGFCLLIAAIWGQLEGKWREVARVLAICVIGALCVRTVLRNQDWHDNLALYSKDIHAVPDSVRAHLNLGDEYLKRRQVEAAQREYQTGLLIDPDSGSALERFGLTESLMGQDRAASADLAKALALAQKDDPNYDLMAWYLATVLTKTGNEDEALKVLNREIDEQRGSTRVWASRAAIRYHRGELESARLDAEAALRLDPGNADAQGLLNQLSQRQKD